MSNKRSPDNTIPTERGGEYALEGFRYQAAYTARLCLELLLEGTVFEEIFCEHHEDVVIKLTNGSFIAIQIKHNKPTNPRLSSSHDQILKTLKRFVSFENEFKGMFSRYIIVSNNFAWSTQKNYRNMKLFLDAAKQYDDLDITKKNAFDSVVENICKSCGINQDDLLNVLKKTYNESAYDYYDYEKMLSVDIGENTNNETLSMYRLILIEKKLISKILECSCINCDHPKKEYFTVLGLPKIEQIKHQISHKRIQKQDVEEIIQYYKKPEFKLTTINENEINDIPIGFKITEQKMILGGINSKTIKNVKNHKISVDEYFTEFYYKDKEVASNLYNGLRSSILTECDECFHSVYNSDELFGQKMYNLFSERAHGLYDDLKQYNYESLNRYHLIGISGILTEECELWWSNEYELE